MAINLNGTGSITGLTSISSPTISGGSLPVGSASAPGLTFSGDTNTGIYSPGADQVAISTSGTQRINIEADGDINIDSGGVFYDATNNRLAVGTTNPGYKLEVANDGLNISVANAAGNSRGVFQTDGDGFGLRSTYNNAGFITFKTVTGGAEQERVRIDNSGRLLVGTSSGRNVGEASQATLQVEGTSYNAISVVSNTNDLGSGSIRFGKSRGTTNGSNTIVQSGDYLGSIIFAGADGGDLETPAAKIEAAVDGTPGANDMPGRLVFSTTADGANSPTERMRIAQNGIIDSFATTSAYVIRTATGAGTAAELLQGLYSASGPASGGTASIKIYTNGNIQNANNSYGALSDIKLKENIVDASSQWNDIKDLRVRKYNFKEGQTHTQIGLIAQEVEPISPGLVTESPDRDAEGNDLGTVTKSVNYSVLYMKAVKALQEAMERIETLEAKVASLEAA